MESKTNDNNILQKQNRIAVKVIIGIAIFISMTYLVILSPSFFITSSEELYSVLFTKIFNSILAVVAAGSCILCYNSTKKGEIFIVSLVHIVFTVDILIGNTDNLNVTSSDVNINDYIFLLTSMLRVIILLITISPLHKLKKLIVENKILSITITIFIVLLSGILKFNKLVDVEFKDVDTFIYYNILLIIVYASVSVVYIVKSLKTNDCIYAIISASTLIFTIKWICAIIGAINPSSSIKIISISITYMGFIIFILGVIWELLSNIKANRILRQELVIFKKIADENKESCILIHDNLDRVIYANDAAKMYLNDNIDISHSELTKIMRRSKFDIETNKFKEINGYISTNGYWSGTIDNKIKGRTINCLIQKIYIEANKHNTVIMFNDISQSIREKTYLLEYEKMKNQEQVRNEFFANISHELRTPLNIFYSTVQLLDMKVEKNQDEFIEIYRSYKKTLKTNCQRMLRLINNIVDITKIDVGFTKPEFKNHDVIRLVEDISLSVINYAKYKEINIVFDTEEEEHIIKCDRDMIERAMLNLLSNAIKFTKSNGNILVNVFVDEDWIRIRVKDDGIGIPIEDQSYIFERFIQTDKSLTRLNEGSGIGLSIVCSIVNLHEGEIYVDSDGIKGTEFEILLPNKKIDDYTEEEFYEVDNLKIELELSDIYELY